MIARALAQETPRRGYRYRIVREYSSAYSDTVAEAATIDDAHAWIVERIRLAGKVGLRLRPLDFDVIDTWEQPCTT